MMKATTPKNKKQLRRWSPLTCLGKTSLSPSGLIQLESDAGEVETLVCTSCELRYEGSGPLPKPVDSSAAGFTDFWIAIDVNLSCHITTHRIVLVDEMEAIAGSIPHPLVQTAEGIGGPSFRSPKGSYKIELNTLAWGELLIVFRGGGRQPYSQSGKDRDAALNAIHRAMKRKAWKDRERQAEKEASRPSKTIAARRVGVDAIMTKNKLLLRENANLAETAFGGNNNNAKSVGLVSKKKGNQESIDAFMREATPLLKVIQKYTSTIERERKAAALSNNKVHDNSSKQHNDTDKLVAMLENMGMTSALSEKQSGSMYHKQLARQIVDFLRRNERLDKAGGMMTLTDVYCLFNRARGTNMISPDDLLKALDLMKELRLGMSRRSFKSGVLVIQDDAFDDAAMAKKLANLASSSMKQKTDVGGITVIDVSKTLKIPALLANEQLQSAEQMGWLCRDSTIEGIRYFPNLFQDAASF
mmetsp:Transcript_18364/g.28818  ORF Transcript_18364/g.28818 Transcript_18364/m.28818 type:complete len:472 (-) Transcript_18364:115-1530(-)